MNCRQSLSSSLPASSTKIHVYAIRLNNKITKGFASILKSWSISVVNHPGARWMNVRCLRPQNRFSSHTRCVVITIVFNSTLNKSLNKFLPKNSSLLNSATFKCSYLAFRPTTFLNSAARQKSWSDCQYILIKFYLYCVNVVLLFFQLSCKRRVH
jgi:hypothetical protein